MWKCLSAETSHNQSVWHPCLSSRRNKQFVHLQLVGKVNLCSTMQSEDTEAPAPRFSWEEVLKYFQLTFCTKRVDFLMKLK